MSGISIYALTKRFGSTTAVDAIDLTIASGELFFLLGPSGCGKTTLLRMIAGFIDPTAGTIRFGERDVTHLPPNQRNTGMVFQSYALWPHMTVEQNVAYGLDVRKVAADEKKRRVGEALRAVHMEQYASRKPNQLSGGQQQRVALARALVIQPTVLLLDEPLSNLDAKLRLEMRSEIRRICKQSGITGVYVTHDQKEALSMADRMAVLRAGQVVQVGGPRELYERPRTRFVADFLGETNFIRATLQRVEGEIAVLESEAGLLRSRLADRAHAARLHTLLGKQMTCSVRPEAWSLAQAPHVAPHLSLHVSTHFPPHLSLHVSTHFPPHSPPHTSPHAAQPTATSQERILNTVEGTLVSTTYLGEVAQHLVAVGDRVVIRVLELNPRVPAWNPANTPTIRITSNADDAVLLED